MFETMQGADEAFRIFRILNGKMFRHLTKTSFSNCFDTKTFTRNIAEGKFEWNSTLR